MWYIYIKFLHSIVVHTCNDIGFACYEYSQNEFNQKIFQRNLSPTRINFFRWQHGLRQHCLDDHLLGLVLHHKLCLLLDGELHQGQAPWVEKLARRGVQGHARRDSNVRLHDVLSCCSVAHRVFLSGLARFSNCVDRFLCPLHLSLHVRLPHPRVSWHR